MTIISSKHIEYIIRRSSAILLAGVWFGILLALILVPCMFLDRCYDPQAFSWWAWFIQIVFFGGYMLLVLYHPLLWIWNLLMLPVAFTIAWVVVVGASILVSYNPELLLDQIEDDETPAIVILNGHMVIHFLPLIMILCFMWAYKDDRYASRFALPRKSHFMFWCLHILLVLMIGAAYVGDNDYRIVYPSDAPAEIMYGACIGTAVLALSFYYTFAGPKVVLLLPSTSP